MILLIDNYDSFSYNLYQMVGEMEPDIRVIRNDERTVEEIREMRPDRIILSPGPGRPEDAGVTMEAAFALGKEIPTLGVCLGPASSRRSGLTGPVRCLRAVPSEFSWPGIIPWPPMRMPFRTALRSPPSQRTAR